MPYVSQKQRRWMYANKPDIAKRWDRKGKNYIKGKGGGFNFGEFLKSLNPKKEKIISPLPKNPQTVKSTPDYAKAIKGFMTNYGAPVATLAAEFANESKKFPITQKYPYLIPALSINETSGGKNETYPHNILNWGIKEPSFKPTSPLEVIKKATSGIGKRSPYYEKFRQTGDLDEFASHYAPPSENDTIGYVANLIKLMAEMKKYE